MCRSVCGECGGVVCGVAYVNWSHWTGLGDWLF